MKMRSNDYLLFMSSAAGLSNLFGREGISIYNPDELNSLNVQEVRLKGRFFCILFLKCVPFTMPVCFQFNVLKVRPL